MAVKQLKTFKDLVDAVREEIGVQSTDETAINRIKRTINIAYQEICSEKQWNWLQGQAQIQLPAYVSSGTAAVVTGSATVTLTHAPTSSKRGHYFAVDNFNEIYRIEAHEAGSDTIKLETEYNGTTNSEVNYKVWTDRIPLPMDCNATIEVRHDHFRNVLEVKGLQEFRRHFAINPRAEGKPQYYYTSDYVDPASTAEIENLPSVDYRFSSGMLKTVVFEGSIPNSVVTKIDAGEAVRWSITGAGHYSYNGEIILSSYSTTNNPNDTVTYVGRGEHTEDPIDDTSMTITAIESESDHDRYRELWVFPAIQPSKVSIHVDYLREVFPLENDGDEPVIPLADRVVLLYLALSGAYDKIAKDSTSADKNYAKFQNKLAKMSGKLQDNMDKPRLSPSKSYLSTKRAAPVRGGNTSGMSGIPGGASSGAIVTGTPNTFAIFDNRGEISGAAGVTVAEFANIAGTLAPIQTQINSLEATMNADIASLDARASELEADMGVAQSDINDLDATVLNNTTNINNLSVTSTDHESRLDTAEPIIAANTTAISDHIADTAAAHAASAVSFTPAGSIEATDVEAAILEVDGDVLTLSASHSAHTSATTSVHGIADTAALATKTGAETLTNKTIAAGSNTISGIADANIDAAAAIARSKLATGTAYGVVVNDSSGALTSVAPGASGNILKSDGTQWTSAVPAATANAAVTSKTAAYTATSSDDIILCDATSAAFTITLPAAASNTGKVFRIKKTDSSANAITVDADGSETIDGSLTRKIGVQYDDVVIASDGTGWAVLEAESVSARYRCTTAFNSTTSTPINFDTKNYDTHNAVTTSATVWRFTAPVQGLYEIVVGMFVGANSWLAVYKNGVADADLGATPGGSYDDAITGSVKIKLLAGEYIDVRSMSGTVTLGTRATANNIYITKVGNY